MRRRADAEQRPPVRCPVCGGVVRHGDSAECAVCKRRVCLTHLARYGHFMQACDECRLADW